MDHLVCVCVASVYVCWRDVCAVCTWACVAWVFTHACVLEATFFEVQLIYNIM